MGCRLSTVKEDYSLELSSPPPRIHSSALRITAVLACFLYSAAPHALTKLEDAALSEVSAQAIAFNLLDVSLSGGVDLSYTGAGNETLTLSDLEISRSDDTPSTFSDPYTLELLPSADGLTETIRLSDPDNADSLLSWDFAADWAVYDGSTNFRGGAIILDDLQSYASSLTIAPLTDNDSRGVGFGLALRASLDNLAFRPRGRTRREGEFNVSGIYLGGADGESWELADIENQPGSVSTAADINGDPLLQLMIDWPKNKVASTGTLQIDNVNVSALAPALPGLLPVGARVSVFARRVQLQYLNVRLRP